MPSKLMVTISRLCCKFPSVNKAVRRKYNLIALVYDIIYRGYVKKTTSLAAQAVPLNSVREVLDIGCGTGELEKKLLAKNPSLKILGIDLSQEMLERAAKKFENFPNLSWKEGDFLKVELEPQRFDAAYSLSNLHYFPDPQAVLCKAASILKPGGFFVLVDWNRNTFKGRVYNRYMSLADPSFVKIYSPEEAAHFFSNAGFQVKTLRRFKVGLLWQMMLVVAKKT